jgi:hypothetical protein
MRRKKTISGQKNAGRKSEQGIIITLVAVFMLFVVGAMAALSIDVVTLYTARSEAQLAADAAALAAARVIANSGATSDSSGAVLANVETNPGPATAVIAQVAEQNQVGGAYLTSANITAITFGGTTTNPTVTVSVQITNLPTFFARIWGRTQVTVGASAKAEAYNPSGAAGTWPVAPTCVKPWLLPNISPAAGGEIFDWTTGAIKDPTLLGWVTPNGAGATRLRTVCAAPNNTDCTPAPPTTVWRYYPGTTDDATGSFPAPSASSCTGCGGFSSYQLSVAGCVQTPISCNSTVNIDVTTDAARDTQTRTAVDNLTHSTGNGGDSVDTAAGAMPPLGTEPFQFLAGTENPVVLSGAMTAGTDVMVSDSLVTVPVIDTTSAPWPPATYPNNLQIIGFVQLFLSPTGAQVPFNGRIHTQVINLVGCGTPAAGGAAGQPILGNGASPVAVRLVSPP